ncbi:unnamed protein product [Lactuca saligna]|uniref:Response regulatory domain-containing protein n=1 Tax=Lactuca saligna TaxID=75948 RepID=A0AA35Y6W6_LACSI|nr:unnamed protein product [Lactuca saligna]
MDVGCEGKKFQRQQWDGDGGFGKTVVVIIVVLWWWPNLMNEREAVGGVRVEEGGFAWCSNGGIVEFRKDSNNSCSRIVWLSSNCIQLQGLDEKKLPPAPTHANRQQMTKRNRNQEEEEIERFSMSSSSPKRGKKVLVVEDDSLQQMIAKKILFKLGIHQVHLEAVKKSKIKVEVKLPMKINKKSQLHYRGSLLGQLEKKAINQKEVVFTCKILGFWSKTRNGQVYRKSLCSLSH